jgi:hypothetical protein
MPPQHRVFIPPSDPNIKIWRYMDFAKFVAMLEDKALFFCRADKLGDRFEGSMSRENLRRRPEMYSPIPAESLAAYNQAAAVTTRGQRQWMYINCWHMNEHESAAMWESYVRSGKGIAIQTTYQKLCDCLPQNDVYVGVVKYLDYDQELMPEGNLFYPYVHKRTSFAHERELRAVISELLPLTGGHLDYSVANPKTGKTIEVDLNALIEQVYIAPMTGTWYADLVQKITPRYGLAKPIKQSTLDKDPVY